MKMTHFTTTPLLLASLLVAGCANGKGPDDITVKENPSPQHGWVMRLDLRGAPSEPKNVEGYASYQTIWSGEVCPSKQMVRFETRMPWQYAKVKMTQVEPGIYEGIFHLDHWQDEAYFERGVCAWRLNTAGASFVGEGGKGFGSGIGYAKIGEDAQSPTDGLDYYYVQDWTSPAMPGGTSSASMVPRNEFKDDLENSRVQDSKTFFPVRISVRAAENAPGLGVREEFKARTGQDIE